MSEFPEQLIPIRGVDRATPAAEAQDGKCLAIENLVPVGPPQNPYWSVSTAPEEKGTFTGLLSIGRQTRERIGPLADLDADPDQSKDRILALKSDGLYVIDPGQSYQERQLYSFLFADDTRRATFTQLGESTFVFVTRGSGIGEPEVTLEVRDDSAEPVRWPALPEFSVSYAEKSNEDNLEEGTYVWRLAWQLDDGSLGPASGPIEASTGAPGTAGNTFEATFTVESFPTPLPDAWDERVSALVLIGHPPVTDGSGGVEVKAINAPGYKVADFDEYVAGSTLDYGENRSDLTASEVYEGSGLLMHEYQAGASFSYNKRLILGDVGYDLYRPDLRKIVQWEEGVENANGDDYWLLMEVEVRTNSGIIRRLSTPLPFDTSHADSTNGVNTKSGLIFYRDSRAVRWNWYFSTDYAGDIDTATWKKVELDEPKAFNEADGATFAYTRTLNEPIDITSATTAENEITGDSNWTDQLSSSAYEYDTEFGEGSDDDAPHDAKIDISDFTANDLNSVTVDIFITFTSDEDGRTADTSTSGEVLVEVLDGNGTVQDSARKTTEGSFTVTVDNFTLSSGKIRIYTDASATATADGSDEATASASAEASEVTVTTSGSSSDETIPLDTSVNQDVDRDPNRIIWSEPYRPLDFPPENLVYAGDENADPVLALTTVGQAVSEGQFGQYPILALSKESVRMVEVGTEPFIRGVSPLTNEMGLVGRRAYANTDGIVTAAMDRGVYQFTPNLEQPAVSDELHDVRDRFLGDLGPDTAVGFYAEDDRGRREIWVAGTNQTWCYSVTHGVWTQLSRQRIDFARLDNKLRGVSAANGLYLEGGSAGTAVSFTLVTSLVHFGEVGYMERLKELYVRQRFMLETLNWKLVAKDPNAAQALKAAPLNRAQLPDGLTARDLLPNVLVQSGTLNRGDLQTIPLASALGYSWFLRFEGTGEPDQGIEGFGATLDERRRVRPRAFFPDQPETVLMEFSVEPDGGDLLNANYRDSNFDPYPTVAAILWGDGASDPTGDATHEYTAGTYTVKVVAQPDFDGLYNLALDGPVDLSTVSFDPIDGVGLKNVLFRDQNDTGDAVGTLSDPIPEGVETIDLFNFKGGEVPASLFPSTLIDLNAAGAGGLTGTFSDLPAALEETVIRSCINLGGSINANNLPDNLRQLVCHGAGVDFEGTDGLTTAEAFADASDLEDLQHNQALRLDTTWAGCRDMAIYVDRGAAARGDLSGDTGSNPYGPDNAPYISGSLEICGGRTALSGYPLDFSAASALRRYTFRTSYTGSVVPDAGKGMGAGLEAMHTELLNGGLPSLEDIHTRATGRYKLDPDTQGSCYVCPYTRDQLDKIMGLGPYHPDAGGQGIIDFGATFNTSKGAKVVASFTRSDSTTLVVSLLTDPIRAGDGNGHFSFRTAQDDGSGNVVIVRERAFPVGNQFRLFDPSTDTDYGLYEIASDTFDASAEESTLTISTSPSDADASTSIPTGAEGKLFTNIAFPRTPRMNNGPTA